MRVSEIRVKRIRVNQGLGVYLAPKSNLPCAGPDAMLGDIASFCIFQ